MGKCTCGSKSVGGSGHSEWCDITGPDFVTERESPFFWEQKPDDEESEYYINTYIGIICRKAKSKKEAIEKLEKEGYFIEEKDKQ